MSSGQRPMDADGVNDPLVTETYREVAIEKTPASINESVLREARRQAGGSYAHALLWMRPAAWAATIGLCLAIVLDLSNLPQPASVAIESDALSAAAPADEQNNLPAASNGDADGRLVSNETALRQLEAPRPGSGTAEAPLLNRDTPTYDPTKASREEALDALRRKYAEAEQRAAQDEAPVDADAFRVTEAPMLEEAASMARMREGPNQAAEHSADAPESDSVAEIAVTGSSVPALANDEPSADVGSVETYNADDAADSNAAFAAAAERKQQPRRNDTEDRVAAATAERDVSTASGFALASDAAPASVMPDCSDAAKVGPEDWLACIERLEDAGFDDEAKAQREALAEAFPTFDASQQ